ncbi:23408_t:CDS:1, partial [Entrophospora sp. SA101]
SISLDILLNSTFSPHKILQIHKIRLKLSRDYYTVNVMLKFYLFRSQIFGYRS